MLVILTEFQISVLNPTPARDTLPLSTLAVTRCAGFSKLVKVSGEHDRFALAATAPMRDSAVETRA